ncbi:Uncharacterised protein [Yersinia thracica]|uniref:Uncharacterized protein n=1 Tax=Yersinia thracica TaxID=2890319 RepID=A0A0T9QNK4_9GAMM|nr:hypothetical protein [Yersinia thracica]CNI19347.1 Uncharacterised protein [Yersinia thracica]
MKERISGFDGSVIEEPSYNGIQIPLQQQGSSVIWHAKVAMTGGGSCDWTLSKLNLGLEYTDATHLRKDLVPGTAVGATIAFDSDASRNGKFSSVYGNLNLAPKYYPYIRERNLGKKENSLSLLGKENFLSLRAYDMNEIKYAPEIDEKKVVIFVGLEKKMRGAYPKIIYPDGSIAPNRTLMPDFEKVDKMIVK